MGKINIMGTDYEIKYQTEKENTKLIGNDGLCETYAKEIIIDKLEADENTLKDLDRYRDNVLRHEVIHAFFHESGLDCNSNYARNEELVDWIAIQFPKIYRAFKELGVLE